jgi:hypothetical protein
MVSAVHVEVRLPRAAQRTGILDEYDPTLVRQLSVIIDADTGGYNNVDVITNPTTWKPWA